MATEKQANIAREQYADWLIKLGAHGIAVDKVSDEKGFAVIVYSDTDELNFPADLKIKQSGKSILIPLITQKSRPFQLE